MKWYSVKKYKPSFEGWYIIRFIDKNKSIGVDNMHWNGKNWLDYDQDDHLFKEIVTHFCIPAPVEIEE
jgi:hypothetical protein